MPNYFPCPNSACTYQFDAEQLPAAAMVTCPLCRTRFPYRAAASRTQSAASKTDGNPFTDEAPRESASQSERPNRLVTPRYIPTDSRSKTALMLVGFTVIVAVVLAIIFFMMKKNPFTAAAGSSDLYVDQNFNFRFMKFDKTWPEDAGLRGKLGTNAFLQKRSNPDAWIGLRAIKLGDNGKRNARPDEMSKELLNLLRRNFTGLEKTPIERSVGDNHQADAFEFQGELKDTDTVMYGEALAFDYKGIGYVFLMFAPLDKWEQVRDELTKMRNSFAFADLRKDWKPEQQEIITHYIDGGNYQLVDEDAIWKRGIPEPKEDDDGPKRPAPRRGEYVRDPKDADEKATMVFRAVMPVKNPQRDRLPEADAMVLVFDKSEGDLLEMVRKYIHDKLKSKVNEGVEIKLVPLSKSPSGALVPGSAAAVGVYRSTNSEDKTQSFYYVISALKVEDKVVAAVGWCTEKDAEYMDRFILKFVASLRERK